MRTIKKWRSQHSPNHFWLDGADDVLAVLEGCSIVRAITGGEIRQAGKRQTCKVVIEQCEHRHRPMILLWYYTTTSAKNQFVIIANRTEGMASGDILDALCAELEPFCSKNGIEFSDRRKDLDSIEEEAEEVISAEVVRHRALINSLLLHIKRAKNTAETLELTDLLRSIRDEDESMAMQSLQTIMAYLDAYDRTNDELRQQVVDLQRIIGGERLQNREDNTVCVNGSTKKHRHNQLVVINPESSLEPATTPRSQLLAMLGWVKAKGRETKRELREVEPLVRHLDQFCSKAETRLTYEQAQVVKTEEERVKLLEAIADAAQKAEVESIGILYESLKRIDARQVSCCDNARAIEKKLVSSQAELYNHQVSKTKLEVMEHGLSHVVTGLSLSLEFLEMLDKVSGDYEQVWQLIKADVDTYVPTEAVEADDEDEMRLADQSRREQKRFEKANRAERRAFERGKIIKKKRSPWMGGGK